MIDNATAVIVVITSFIDLQNHFDADTSNSLFEAAPTRPLHEQRKPVTIVTAAKYSDGNLKGVFCDST